MENINSKQMTLDRLLCRGNDGEVVNSNIELTHCGIHQVNPELICKFLNDNGYCRNSTQELITVYTDRQAFNLQQRIDKDLLTFEQLPPEIKLKAEIHYMHKALNNPRHGGCKNELYEWISENIMENYNLSQNQFEYKYKEITGET